MAASGKEGVEGVKEADYKWGEEKSKNNYKSVSISGEVYDVGHCVQCNLESKEAYIWKILKLFQEEDRKMCRIRRLFREVDLPQNVKGLDPLAEVNELFLASQGIDMQEDIPLEKIARKSKIFCTFQDDNGMNTIPSSEQIKDADYFFYRGYDPTNEEVIALDDVVDELGAQYVYNKNWWFGDKVGRPSSSQVSGGRIPSQSHASGSSAHKVTTKGKESSPYKSPLSTLKTRMSNRDIDDIMEIPLTTSPQQQTSERRIFKRIEDWDATLPSAVHSQRVLLLKNVDPEFHSEDFSEALTQSMKIRCEVRIAPPVSFSYRTTTALVKLPSIKKAQEFLEKTKSSHLLVADRVVTVTTFTSDDLRAPPLKHYGHLDFSQTLRDQHVDDYKNAVATSHLAQGNTIEFAYGLPWRVLDEQHEDQWRLLQEAHSQDRTDIGSVSRKKQ